VLGEHTNFGPPFGRGPIFGGGRGRRRRGDLRAALLLLLAEEPRNGYQLMQAIDELSGGRWRPSPGSIYPTLAQLEDQGLIRSTERAPTAKPLAGSKLFEITSEARKHLKEHRDHAPPWIDGDETEAFQELRSQVKQFHLAAMQVAHAGREEQIRAAADALAETRRRLYRILAEEDDA
jgi:DNA-binding PadR family transcriptional regulator